MNTKKLICSIPGAELFEGAFYPVAHWVTGESTITVEFYNSRRTEIYFTSKDVSDFFMTTSPNMSELEQLEIWRKNFELNRTSISDFRAIVILTAMLAIEPPTPPTDEDHH